MRRIPACSTSTANSISAALNVAKARTQRPRLILIGRWANLAQLCPHPPPASAWIIACDETKLDNRIAGLSLFVVGVADWSAQDITPTVERKDGTMRKWDYHGNMLFMTRNSLEMSWVGCWCSLHIKGDLQFNLGDNIQFTIISFDTPHRF